MTFIQAPYYDPPSDWKPPNLGLLPNWTEARRVAIDVETRDPQITTLGPGVRRDGYVVGISFAIEGGPAAYLPVAHAGGDNLDPALVWAYLRQQAKNFRGEIVGANIGYDLDYLAENGIWFGGARFRDVQIAEPLLDELQFKYSLDEIAHRRGFKGKDEAALRRAASHWGLHPKKELWKLPARHVGVYATGDVALCLDLLRAQEVEIDRDELRGVYDLECALIPALVKIRRRGIRIDFAKLDHIERWALAGEREALDRAHAVTGVRLEPEDVWKAEAVARVLEATGAALPYTPKGAKCVDADVVAGIDHEAARAIARARKLDKLRTTFAESVRRYATRGRIHCILHQLKNQRDGGDLVGAGFGRFSSTDPNLQQQPARDPELGPLWRSIYVPEDGEEWAAIDYCYDAQTDILTERGWVKFPDLKIEDRVAQWWGDGHIDYVTPLARIRNFRSGPMIRIRGERQVDLLVTPDHRCFLLRHGVVEIKLAANYPDKAYIQPQNGVLEGTVDRVDIRWPRLAAAIQADGSDRGAGYRIFVSKPRKILRLRQLLNGISYTEGFSAAKGNQTWFYIPKCDGISKFLRDGKDKTFNRENLLALHPQDRCFFLDELLLWDGEQKSKIYFSTNLKNCQIVQEIAVLSGYRSNLKSKALSPWGRKAAYCVTLNKKPGTWVDTLNKTIEPYEGEIFCVTVPSGAVVVRRSGRPCVSGNSAQEPRWIVHYAALVGAPGGAEAAAWWTEDPKRDVYVPMAERMGRTRRDAKTIFLGLAYGMGGGKLCRQLDLPTEWKNRTDNGEPYEAAGPEGQAILDSFNAAAPYVKVLRRMVEGKAVERGYVRTHSGRRCRFERYPNGETKFAHKALNRIIQGSSADQTKTALLRMEEAGLEPRLQIHDEICLSVASRDRALEGARIMEAAIQMKLPARAVPKIGPSWGEGKES